MRICVFASGSKNIDKGYLNEAYNLGKIMSNCGHELVFGGGLEGMMGAVARGVHDNNGRITSILPEWMDEFEDIYRDSDEVIYTKSMADRKELFNIKSDAFIILPGGVGTLDELFEVITLKKLKKHNKAIIILNIDNFYDLLIDMLEDMVKKM